MSDFKKGDKVTHADAAFFSETYSVIRSDKRLAFVEDAKGVQYTFAVRNLTLADETPKVGDRVRLVHEGVVTDISGVGSGTALLIDGSSRILGRGETVEILERAPKPYAVGTVAMGDIGPLVRFADGRWLSPKISVSGFADRAGLTDDAIRERYEIVYEPPASRA